MSKQPQPEVIRQTAEDVIQRPHFDLQPSEYDLTVLSRIRDFLENLFEPVLDAFGVLFDISPFLAWAVVLALLVVAIALIVHVVYSFRSAIHGRKHKTATPEESRNRTANPLDWEKAAEAASENEDYTKGLRCLFRACLIRLEQANRGRVRPGTTNREYMQRYRNTPAADPLSLMVQLIDSKWYGGEPCNEEEYSLAHEAHSRLKTIAVEMNRAHSS
jgi:hypothetical protein